MAAPDHDRRDPRRQRALPRPRRRALRRQVGHRLRRARPVAGDGQAAQGARRASFRARSATGWRSAPAPATSGSTSCARAWSASTRPPTSRPGMIGALERHAPAARHRRSHRLLRGGASCRSPTTPSTSSSATPCCTTCPTWRARSASSCACCAPAGAIAFCGEPSHYGDRIAELPKRAAYAVAPAWRALMRATPPRHGGYHQAPEEDDLERIVDVHAFTPGVLSASARAAGLRRRATCAARSWRPACSAGPTARSRPRPSPSDVPWLWRQYAYRGYLTLQALDRALLEPRLPAGDVLQPAGQRAGAGGQ